METESHPPKPEQIASEAEPKPALGRTGIQRRTLLRAGASATPVLLTLGSGPVSAGMMPCTVASSYVSARTFASRNAQTSTMTCSSKNAYTWNDEACRLCGGGPTSNSNWPAWAQKKLSEHFPSCPGTSDFDNECLGWIMKGRNSGGVTCSTSGPLAVLQGILGLTLTMDYSAGSIQMSGTNGATLTKSYLKDVWSQYKTSQKFVVAGSVAWAETDILRWLWLLQSNTPVSNMFT